MKVNYKQIYSNYKHTDNRDIFRNFFLAIVFTGIYLFPPCWYGLPNTMVGCETPHTALTDSSSAD